MLREPRPREARAGAVLVITSPAGFLQGVYVRGLGHVAPLRAQSWRAAWRGPGSRTLGCR